jgi:hypothetical protein
MSVMIFGDELPTLVFADMTVDYNNLEVQLHITGKITLRDSQTIVKTSILTGRRNIEHKGSYAAVELTVILPTGSTWAFDDHLSALLAREGSAVTVHPNRDSFQSWEGHILSVKPFYYDDDTAYHAYTIIAQSDDYISLNLEDTLPENTVHAVDQNGDSLVDHDGNSLLFRYQSGITES